MEKSRLHFRFGTKRLEQLYYEEKRAEKYPAQVVESFFRVMAIIANAPDERDLYALKSLHFEQLKGARGKRGERSIRLNREYRLIVAVERDQAGHSMLIIRIEKHYGD
jgi:toxin HigB-1